MMKTLTIRPMQIVDAPLVVDYWVKASPEDLARMGAEASRIPSKDDFLMRLMDICRKPESELTTFYLIWLVDGERVGHSSLKNVVRGHHAEMHLHMWSPALRGKGYGSVLFCLSALDFYERFRLQSIVCEPGAANPMPNRMLQKIGFQLERTYVGASSDLSAVCQLNRYYIDSAVAARYLETGAGRQASRL